MSEDQKHFNIFVAFELLKKLYGFASNDFTAQTSGRSKAYTQAYTDAGQLLKGEGVDIIALRGEYISKQIDPRVYPVTDEHLMEMLRQAIEALEGIVEGTTIEFAAANGFYEQRMLASEVYDKLKWGLPSINQ